MRNDTVDGQWLAPLQHHVSLFRILLLVAACALELVDVNFIRVAFDDLLDGNAVASWGMAAGIASGVVVAATGAGIALRSKYWVRAAACLTGWACVGAALLYARSHLVELVSGLSQTTPALSSLAGEDLMLAILMAALYILAGACIITESMALFNPARSQLHQSRRRLHRLRRERAILEAKVSRAAKEAGSIPFKRQVLHQLHDVHDDQLDALGDDLRNLARYRAVLHLGHGGEDGVIWTPRRDAPDSGVEELRP